ncbi:hypothetical protein ACFL2C_02775 [Patescibacteria group bacterium]
MSEIQFIASTSLGREELGNHATVVAPPGLGSIAVNHALTNICPGCDYFQDGRCTLEEFSDTSTTDGLSDENKDIRIIRGTHAGTEDCELVRLGSVSVEAFELECQLE